MPDYVFFKSVKCHCKVKLSDILYVRAEKKLVNVVTTTGTVKVLESFKEVEQSLPPLLFYKVHRSYIISLSHTEKFDNEFVYMREIKIPIAGQYRSLLKTVVAMLTSYGQSLRMGGDDIDDLLRNLNQ